MCIRVLRDKPQGLREKFNAEASGLSISSVVLYELLYSAAKSARHVENRHQVEAFYDVLIAGDEVRGCDAKRRRRMFTAAESAEVLDRWQRGEGLKLIGRSYGKTSSSIFAHLKPHGGIRPAPRRRSRRMLSMDEREDISRGIAAGVSLLSIATSLHRAPSTVSRELQRNGGQRRYRAAAARNSAQSPACD